MGKAKDKPRIVVTSGYYSGFIVDLPIENDDLMGLLPSGEHTKSY